MARERSAARSAGEGTPTARLRPAGKWWPRSALVAMLLLAVALPACVPKPPTEELASPTGGVVAPAELVLTATVRDVLRGDREGGHPDFESFVGSVQHLVEPQLGPDRTPVLANPGSLEGGIHSAESFYQWYHDVEGVNESVPLELTLALDGDAYGFRSNSFFPIDDQLFGNQGLDHNFHFTLELHTQFAYERGQRFRFSGDDDVWVFIDDELALDLGGVHPSLTKVVELDTLGLTPGEVYPLDLFFAERHTDESNFRIETGIVLIDVPSGPPVAEDQLLETPGGVALPIELVATDPDDALLAYRIVAPPEPGIVLGEPPFVTYVASPRFTGVDFFEFVANDGSEDSNVARVTIDVLPSAAVEPVTDLYCRPKWDKIDVTWSAVPGAASYELFRSDGGAAFQRVAETEALVYADFDRHEGGVYTYWLVAHDDQGGASVRSNPCAAEPAAMSRGRPPEIVSSPGLAVLVGETYEYDVDAVDPDGDDVAYSLALAPTGMTIDAATGLIRWTPAADQIGESPVTVRAVDPGGLSGLQAFYVIAVAANEPPVTAASAALPGTTADAGGPYEAEEGAVFTLDGSGSRSAAGDPLVHRWHFDGKSYLGALAQVSLADQGEATATLSVDDGRGGVDDDRAQVRVVNAEPEADAGPDQLGRCEPYDPDLGILPSDQGWAYGSAGPDALAESGYSLDVSAPDGLRLVQDDTGDPRNLQHYLCTTESFDFAEHEVRVDAEVEIFTSTFRHARDPDEAGFNRAGWSIGAVDVLGRQVSLHIGDTGLFLVGEGHSSTDLVPFESRGALHRFALVIGASGASVFVDGGATPAAWLRLSSFGSRQTDLDRIEIGDTSAGEHSSSALRSFAVSVSGAPPAPPDGPPVGEGELASIAGSFTDAGVLDVHTAEIDWGDETRDSVTPSQGAGEGTAEGSHVYLDSGLYTATLTVTDDDGGAGSDDVQVRVRNAAPEVHRAGELSVTAGETLDQVLATFSDAGSLDTHEALVSWGDEPGVFEPATVVGRDGSGTVSGFHVYANRGTYLATVVVVDDDGGTGYVQLEVSVGRRRWRSAR